MSLAYDLLSSALLLVCASVQANDPDPALWIALYALGGPALTLLWRTAPPSASRALTAAWIAGVAAFGVQLARQLWASFVPDDSGSSTSLLWQALEHELGREIGGCLVLIVHACTLWTLHRGGARFCSLVGVFFIVSVAAVWWLFQREMAQRLYSTAPHCLSPPPAVEPTL